MSTPKSEEKFKWTIDDISSLKPADIDDATLSQHVHINDPTVESIVQEKIDTFFSNKVILPSPMTEEVKRAPLMAISSPVSSLKPKVCDGKFKAVSILSNFDKKSAPSFVLIVKKIG